MESIRFLADFSAKPSRESKFYLLNPFFYPIPASPYPAAKNLGVKIDIEHVIKCFRKLDKIHDIMLV